MIAGIVLDSYKLRIFKKHLDKAGFEYTEHPGITKDTVTLKVKCNSREELEPTVREANTEATNRKHGKF